MTDAATPACAPRRLLRLPEVLHRTGLSRSTLYVWMERGEFPRPVPLGPRMVAWDSRAIEAWIEEKVTNAGRLPPKMASDRLSKDRGSVESS